MKYMTEQMIDEYLRMLLSWAYKKFGQKEKAEELVQEVWLQVFRAMGDIGYLTTVFAFQDGRLYVPKDNHDGEFLTLMYIKK